jgi:hypothetical protein
MAPLGTPGLGYSLLYFLYIFFYFDIDFLHGVQNSIAVHAKIYLMTNSFGDRKAVGGSYVDFFGVRLSNEKSSKAPSYTHSKLGRAHSRSLIKNSRSSRISTIRIRVWPVWGTLILADLPSHW